ncbi:MAG: hypothetical protein AAF599_19945 [Bacteroidota bacterium]
MSVENKYYYQRFELPQIQFARTHHDDDWEIFLRRIGLDRSKDDPNNLLQEHLLDSFATHLMGNIHWYEKKVVKEKSIRLIYVFLSLVLLLLTPLAVATIAKTGSLAAEITVILTGAFALYLSINKWLKSRNLIAIYWQTKSNLKSRLYALEDKWYHQENWSETHIQALVEDLKTAVKFGMDTQKVEKQLFFQNYTSEKIPFQKVISVDDQIKEEFARLTEEADAPTNKVFK